MYDKECHVGQYVEVVRGEIGRVVTRIYDGRNCLLGYTIVCSDGKNHFGVADIVGPVYTQSQVDAMLTEDRIKVANGITSIKNKEGICHVCNFALVEHASYCSVPNSPAPDAVEAKRKEVWSDVCICGHELGEHSQLSTGCYAIPNMGCACSGYERAERWTNQLRI